MPSPAARRIGKTKVQKTASGSRMNSRKRTRVSWAIELRLNPRWARDTVGFGSLIAQMPASQHHEDILDCSGGLSWLGRREVRDVDGFAEVAGFPIEALKESERLVDRQLLGELGVLQLDSE